MRRAWPSVALFTGGVAAGIVGSATVGPAPMAVGVFVVVVAYWIDWLWRR